MPETFSLQPPDLKHLPEGRSEFGQIAQGSWREQSTRSLESR
jgi:hypothetical protein